MIHGDNTALKDRKELTINIGTEPYTLDFQSASSTNEIQIYNWIMEGLTRSISNGRVKPGLAEKWDISKDGKVWTFYLRDAKWSDGKPVTAYDFKFGWMRALDIESPKDYEYLLYDILNVEEYINGKATDDSIGIDVINDKTLKVTLKHPVTYFDYLVSLPIYAPVRADIYNKLGSDFNTEVEYFMTNGPFKVESWKHESDMVFVKNQEYWDEKSIKLEKVNAFMIDSNSTELLMYDTGDLDVIARLYKDSEVSTAKELIKLYTDGTVWYLNFNCKDQILSNKNIRKALTLAIDRKSVVNGMNVACRPALAFVAPEIIQDYDGKTFREKIPAYFKDKDISTAKKLLAQGLKELKLKKLPKLTLMIDDNFNVISHGKTYIDMWKNNLGIDVEIEPIKADIRFNRLHRQEYQISIGGWGPDFPDAITYLDLFVTDFYYNDTAYSNPKYDELIKAARAEVDKKKRSELLHKAEQILMDDMPIGPIYFRYWDYAIKEYVKNLERNEFGADIDFIYSYIEGKNQ